MERYLNRNGNSSVTYYQFEATSITIWFKGSTRSYTYSYKLAGQYYVENMKQLALKGSGLGAYINKNVRNLFDK